MGHIGTMLENAQGAKTYEACKIGGIAVRLIPSDRIKIADTIINPVDESLWTVLSIKEDANGLGIWAQCVSSDMSRWFFDKELFVKDNVADAVMDPDEVIRQQVSKCESVIDLNGIEHRDVMVVYISRSDWDKWVADGSPDIICGIYSKDISGPGVYYLAGADYLTGYDSWCMVSSYCMHYGEHVMTQKILSALDRLMDVTLVLRERDHDRALYEEYVTGMIHRKELVSLLQSGKVKAPDCTLGQELLLRYVYGGNAYYVSISNKVSDNPTEWYQRDIGGEEVCSQIMAGSSCYTVN